MSFPKYPAYKDSGVEWLGEVPEHWSVMAIKRVCAVVGGSTPKSDQDAYWDGDITWVTPADLSRLTGFEIHDSMRTITAEGLESCGTTIVPEGSVILSTRAPIGSLGIAAKALCTNQGCKALVPNGPSSRLLAYLLTASNEALNVRGKGTTFLELSGDELGAFVVPLASVPEQTAIASFLDHETAKIDALVVEQQKLIDLLQEKRQAVISHAVTKGLNPNVHMKDSGVEWLGEVPEHWDTGTLNRVARRIVVGIAEAATHAYVDSGVPILRSTNIRAGRIIGEILHVAPSFAEERGSKEISAGDLITVRTGNAGVTAVIPEELDGCQCFTMLITSLLDDNCGAFYCYWMNGVAAQHYFALEGWGTAQVNISVPILKALPVPIPPTDEQAAIVSFLDREIKRLDDLTSEAESVIRTLQERRTALISAAVTGQIDVRNWSVSESA